MAVYNYNLRYYTPLGKKRQIQKVFKSLNLVKLSGSKFGDMTVIFVTFVTYHVTFECFEGKFIYDVKGTLRLMINLKVILNLNILINKENIREI